MVAVIVYHARMSLGDVQVLSGGYLGVDVFFVISGYLITTLLMTELAGSGRISLINFYQRRARRLLPGLLVVMLAALPFAWYLMLPEQLGDFGKSLIFSLAFSSNFYWDYSLQQYGGDSALLQPFLHTWSLAVEEQYYIVFPVLLFAIYKWGRQYLVGILLSLLVLSLLFAQWKTGRNASFSFYMMPTRFWELLGGSFLALAELNALVGNPNRLWQKAMPSLGLALVVGSFVSFNFRRHHPGFITLIPVVGSMLIIGFNSQRGWVTRALSRPAMVYLGLLSYSLYLWHYPIFAFGRMAETAPSAVHKGAWVVATLFLSMLSYHLVEKPFRSKKVAGKVVVFSLLLGSCTVIFVSLNWIWGDDYPHSKGSSQPRRSGYLEDAIAAGQHEEVHQQGVNCNSGGGSDLIDVSASCVFEYAPGAPTLVLVGDSQATAISESVRALAQYNQLNYVQVTQSGCPHLRVSDRSVDPFRCLARAEALASYLSGLERPTIIYSALLPLYLEPGQAEDFVVAALHDKLLATYPDDPANVVAATLQPWVDDGHELVIIYPGPAQGFNVFRKLRRAKPPITSADQLPTLSSDYGEYKKWVAGSYTALDKVIGPRVKRVYPERLFCREKTGRCIAAESDRFYFANDTHVAALGSDLIAAEVASEMGLKIPDSFRK